MSSLGLLDPLRHRPVPGHPAKLAPRPPATDPAVGAKRVQHAPHAPFLPRLLHGPSLRRNQSEATGNGLRHLAERRLAILDEIEAAAGLFLQRDQVEADDIVD